MLPSRTGDIDAARIVRFRSDYSCCTVCKVALASFDQRPFAHAAITRKSYGMHSLAVGRFVHFRYDGGLCGPGRTYAYP